MADQPRVTRFKINWGDNPKGGEGENGEGCQNEMEAGEGSAVQDTDSMLEPLPSTFKE